MRLIIHWLSILTGVVMFLVIREIARLIKEIKDGDSEC